MTTNQTIDGVPRRKIHNLKIHAGPFNDLVSGAKTGEVRTCDDRDFQVGDRVELFLVDDTGGNATRSIVRDITHIQRGYGLPDDVCVLSYGTAAQPQGVPVAYDQAKENKLFEDWAHTQSDVSLRLCDIGLYYKRDTGLAHDAWQYRAKLAEQPAPLAVVLPERLNHSDGLHTYEYVTGHNAAIDKMLGVKS